MGYPGGKVTVGSATVMMLVHYAFDIDEHQIHGGPEWVSTSRFDVTGVDPAPQRPASTEPDRRATPTNAEREMLQNLLVERFGLKIRRSTQDGPVFLLIRGKGLLQLTPSEHPERDPRGGVFMKRGGVPDGEAAGINMSMGFLAKQLTPEMDRPVLDRTGLSGGYDFHLLPNDPTNQDMATAIFDCMRRLGLKLEAGKAPVETLTIEEVHLPTAN